MAAGFGLLGLEPRTFWSMTLTEIRAALNYRARSTQDVVAPRRDDLSAMMQLYPDEAG